MLPEYPLPEIIQEALLKREFSRRAGEILASMLPNAFNLETYSDYFSALIRIEEGKIQYAIPR
jgi:hypothetical protein